MNKPQAPAELLTIQTGRKICQQILGKWGVKAEIGSRLWVELGSGKDGPGAHVSVGSSEWCLDREGQNGWIFFKNRKLFF